MRLMSKTSMATLGAMVLAATAMAAEVPVGMVIAAQSANIDRAPAALGANVYKGDTLNTTSGGTLHLRVGSGQLYVLAMTTAMMSEDSNRLVARILSGTAGLSATAADPLEIETPAGVLRPADNGHAYGQVTVLAPNKVLITSYEGTLLLTRNGESRKIEAGKSYSVSVPAAAGGAAQTPQGYPNGPSASTKSQDIFDGVVIGGTALTGWLLWRTFSESPDAP